jgi:hypothetical protein
MMFSGNDLIMRNMSKQREGAMPDDELDSHEAHEPIGR